MSEALDRMDRIENRFEEAINLIDNIKQSLRQKNEEIEMLKGIRLISKVSEKKNSHLHILLETSLVNKIKLEAKNKKISLAELVRQKLRENKQLDMIEGKIDNLLKNG